METDSVFLYGSCLLNGMERRNTNGNERTGRRIMRKMTAVLTGALMIFTLAACGKEEAPSLPGESTELGGSAESDRSAGADSAASSAQKDPKETEGASADMGDGQTEKNPGSHAGAADEGDKTNLSGTVPEELEYIPAEYNSPSEHPGTLEKLTYQTWES